MSSTCARLLAVCLAGGGALVGALEHPGAGPTHPGETSILLLADGPLTAGVAPSSPPLALAAAEVVLNSEVVPAVEIQSGLLMRPLGTDPVHGRSFSVVEWPADVSLRRHWHPVTERLLMLEGSITSPVDGPVVAGAFWEAPPEVAMGPFTSSGSVFLFLGEGPFETYYLEEGEEAPREGRTLTIDPATVPWQRAAGFMGGNQAGEVRVLRPPTDRDRGVYLLRLTGAMTPGRLVLSSNVEGYVLSGTLRLSDPYHGVHELGPGFYFRIPGGFPFGLSSS